MSLLLTEDEKELSGAILEVMMPGMDGITVLTKLRERGSAFLVLEVTE